MLFNAVVQAVILFGLETWVMNSRMGQALVVSNTGSPDRSLGGKHRGRKMGVVINHLWIRQWKRKGSMIWENMS